MYERILVTGAQGFLGRHVVAHLLTADVEAVLGIGRSPQIDDVFTHELQWQDRRVSAPVPESLRASLLDPRYNYSRLDVADNEEVAKAARRFAPDAVIHTAAALRDSSWPALVRSNLEGTYGLLQGIASAGHPRLVLVSSGSVYGDGGLALPFREDGPLEPVGLYGASKRAAEDVARILGSEHRMSLTQARVFNLIGPGLQEGHLPAVLAARLTEMRRGLTSRVLRLGRLDGTRDFIDVRDAAAALVLLLNRRDAPAVVNVASGRETPTRALLNTYLSLASELEVRVEVAGGRLADVSRACADVHRLRALGHTEGHTLRETLEGMLQYFQLFPA